MYLIRNAAKEFSEAIEATGNRPGQQVLSFLVHLKQLSLASQKRRAQFGSFNAASRKKRLQDHVLCGQSRVDRRSRAVDAGLLKVGTNFVYVVQVLDNR